VTILNLLTKEKRVVGIEINEQSIRLAFLMPVKKARGVGAIISGLSTKTSKTKRELVLIEKSIPAGTIEDGVVIDQALLGSILKKIWEKVNLKTYVAIVSIPSDKIYSHIFSFPGSIDGARFTEAVHLDIDFQLPIKKEKVYIDWEDIGDTPGTKEILLSTIPREISNGYIAAFETAGIKMLALESDITSIARAVKIEPKQATLLVKETPEGSTVFIVKDGTLRFTRILPKKFLSKTKLKAEIKRIKNSFEFKSNNPVIELSLDKASVPLLVDHPKESQLEWLIAVGAAMRGEIPKGEDSLISLLPVNTREAFAHEKTNTFIILLRNITIGISVFFVIAFSASYILIMTLSQYANRTVIIIPASSLPPDLLQKKLLIEQINILTTTGKLILAGTPIWSTVIDEVMVTIIDGITVSRFSTGLITEGISLAGVARDRETLNLFKKSMQKSDMFTQVELPITNLEQKADIPFSISFILKDSSMIYYK